MTFAAVFSTWMGGSIPVAWTYFRTSWICFLLLAGLIMTWKELWGMLQVIALGAAVDVLIAVFMRADFDKSGLAATEWNLARTATRTTSLRF